MRVVGEEERAYTATEDYYLGVTTGQTYHIVPTAKHQLRNDERSACGRSNGFAEISIEWAVEQHLRVCFSCLGSEYWSENLNIQPEHIIVDWYTDGNYRYLGEDEPEPIGPRPPYVFRDQMPTPTWRPRVAP